MLNSPNSAYYAWIMPNCAQLCPKVMPACFAWPYKLGAITGLIYVGALHLGRALVHVRAQLEQLQDTFMT
jgi:hypothetical protein